MIDTVIGVIKSSINKYRERSFDILIVILFCQFRGACGGVRRCSPELDRKFETSLNFSQ
jgi:hypothetical protein